MSTLLAKFLAKPTAANAARIAQYAKRHPWSPIGLSHLEDGLLAEAAALFNQRPAAQQKAA